MGAGAGPRRPVRAAALDPAAIPPRSWVMPRVKEGTRDCLALLGDLVRLTAPPASEAEICEQGLAILTKALGSSAGALFLAPRPDLSRGAGPAAAQGETSAELASAALHAMATAEAVEAGGRARRPARVAIPLPGPAGPVGAIALEDPGEWSAGRRALAGSAARILAAALQSARLLEEGRRQREQLVQRNLELETLRELAGSLQETATEGEILQASLELVLEKLGLASGWIFWGEASTQTLKLAASQGIAERFVKQAQEEGLTECLCMDVFTSGRLRLARNTTECPRLPDLVCGDEPMTHACIPLKFERGTLGVLNIANRPGRLFTRQELQFLETVGSQICLAVDKARTRRAESRLDAEARALASISRAIGGSLDQARVLAAVGEYARDLLRADRCAIFLGDGSEPLLFAHLSGPAMAGLEVGSRADDQAFGASPPLELVRDRKTLVVQDAFQDPRVSGEQARRWNIRSLLVVPLIAHGRLQGFMSADRSKASGWSASEVQLADAFAGQAALAIDNARLYHEMKEALLRLQQARHGMVMAERMAALGTLASSLAHEVRNPLNSISLQLVLLSRRLERGGDPAQKTEVLGLVKSARAEIARLDGLVEEFLSIRTLDRLSLSEIRPDGLVREVMELMGPVADRKGVEVIEESDDDLPRVQLDREKMKQVLINLVRNAIEAMPDGGKLTVSLRGSADAAVISVSDTGVGIQPGLDIFEFFTTTKRGGTGLGLPIARRIVEAHGGSLDVESEPGRGATFRVTLKRHAGAQATIATRAGA
jgi:signal transduction histidine kinase